LPEAAIFDALSSSTITVLASCLGEFANAIKKLEVQVRDIGVNIRNPLINGGFKVIHAILIHHMKIGI
jgi:hypothetical protein